MPLMSPRLAGNARLQAAADNNPSLGLGSKGEAVVILQEVLIEFGANMPRSTAQGTKSPDGIYGAETVGAVKDFQARHGLIRDGITGRQTLTTMDALLLRPKPPDVLGVATFGMRTARHTT